MIFVHYIPAQLKDWLHDKLCEGALQLFALRCLISIMELLKSWVVVVVSPKASHEHILVNLEFLGVIACKLIQRKSPSEVARAESYSALCWIYLEAFVTLSLVG